MGKKAPFGRPVPRDPLRLWWEAKRRSRAFWGNALLILAVGGGGGLLIAAVTSRDGSRTDNRAIATRPRQTVPGVVLSASTSTPSPLAAPTSSTTTSTSTGTGSALSVPPAARSGARFSRGVGTTASVAPGTTVPDPGVVYTVIHPARGSPATTFSAGPTPTQSPSTTAVPPTSTTSTSTTTTAPSPLIGGLPGLLR